MTFEVVLKPKPQTTPTPIPTSQEVIVQNAPGSSSVGCQPNCFIPNTVTINTGGTVTWKNPDNMSHVVTSGTPSSGPNGIFDSRIINVGGSFSHKFNTSGTYDYFCMIHPWMEGKVVVKASSLTSTSTEDEQTEDQQTKKSQKKIQKSKRGELKHNATQTEESATDQHETKKKDSDCKRKCR